MPTFLLCELGPASSSLQASVFPSARAVKWEYSCLPAGYRVKPESNVPGASGSLLPTPTSLSNFSLQAVKLFFGLAFAN